MTLHEMQRRTNRFDIRKEVKEVIESTQDEITALNKKQLFAGIRSTGTEIKPEYAPYTILLKDQKGQPTDRVTLKDKEDFYNGFFVDVNSATFVIDSRDSKTEALIGKYGEKILGLTNDSRGEYVAYTFFPSLRDRVTKKLGFKFS